MAADADEPPSTAANAFAVSGYESRLLMRLRQIKKQAQRLQRVRVEVEITSEEIAILEVRVIKPEVFAN